MEIIGYGILLAIGWYLAPIVLSGIVMIGAVIVVGIASIFGRK